MHEALTATAAEPAEAIGWFAATILGIVEGVTEFLPVSSTGHLIVANAFLGESDPAFVVAIQIGAISAIAVLYRERLIRAAQSLLARPAVGSDGEGGGEDPQDPSRPAASSRNNLWLLLVTAAVPAAVLGLAFEDAIEALLFSPMTVAITLSLGGVLLLLLERWLDGRADDGVELQKLETMRYRDALGIGLFQCLALIPGTSRSGATIAGALILKFDRVAAAEFSFLVGLPVLYGACALKLVSDYERLMGPLFTDFLIACVVSFVTAYAVVGPFVRYLQANTFRVFGWYRILAGLVLFALIATGSIG